MYTFSQMVDEMVSETKRPDLVSEIARYVNQTIREVHFDPERNVALFFPENLREVQIVATSEYGQAWEIPNPQTFQQMLGVALPARFDGRGQAIWSKETSPGRHLNDLEYFHYRVGGSYVFSGYGGIGGIINLAYYEYPRSHKYFTAPTRPAQYDPDEGWTYAAGVTTPELQEAARIITTNWLLMRWSDVISEGVRAKLYKRLSDTERARTCYSMFKSLAKGLWTSETASLYAGV